MPSPFRIVINLNSFSSPFNASTSPYKAPFQHTPLSAHRGIPKLTLDLNGDHFSIEMAARIYMSQNLSFQITRKQNLGV